jgi:hypothetical protein
MSNTDSLAHVDTASQYAAGWEAYQQGLGKWACTDEHMVQGWDDAHSEAADSWWLTMMRASGDDDMGEDVSYPSEWERWA